MSDHWVHNLSPFIIEFWPGVGIRWYGMAYLAGLVIGYFIARRWVDQKRVPLTRAELQDFVLYGGLGMIIGGRVGYCLLYNFSATISNPLTIFMVMDGGMASHGGIIGLAVGCWLFCYKRKRNFFVLGDLIAATGTLGIGCGRIANFINGELWGRKTDVPWAVIFPGEVPVPEGTKDVLAYQLAHISLASPRHPSQLYAAVFEGFLIFSILYFIHVRHFRPGLTGAGFIILYAFGRFFGEFFREPDNGQFLISWVSRGQAYTLPMFIIGFTMLYMVLRRPARPDLYLVPDEIAASQTNSDNSNNSKANDKKHSEK